MEEGGGVMAAVDGGSTSQRDENLLEPKHSIFLSHSGAQKSFVDQLCLDIERHDRYAFFDKRRDSLPIGCNFPKLIFEAINQCQVAVVVLSEEFFSRSKWPMLELAALVKRKIQDQSLTIMPVFLGLTHAQCRDKLNHERWMRIWQGWANVDSKIDLREWQAALKVFGYTNGICVNEVLDEVKCRGDIMEAVCKKVPPRTRWDDSHVQGRARLCMEIRATIDGMHVSRSCGTRIVGVYGVGGIGKTTACKVLCNDYFEEFEGKVCHVEFGIGSKLLILQEVLKRLTNTNRELIKNFSEDECKDTLRRGLKEKVFLAIDNVFAAQQIVDEARDLLRIEFMPGSIVVVTARSLGQLRNLNLEECMEMPELDEDDARSLFLYHAAPSSYSKIANEMNEHLLKQCIKRCYFRKGDDRECHYHPLALKVLGGQLGNDSKEWIEKLNDPDPFNQYEEEEKEHPIFSILGRSFETLKQEDQFIFMDAAIFFPKQLELFNAYNNLFKGDVFEWLSMVHGKSLYVMKQKLEGLKGKSLLENLGDGRRKIGMHDLWREFAIMKSKGGEFDSRPWIYEKIYALNDRRREEPKLSTGSGWENLQRICMVGDLLKGCPVKEIELSCCPNLRVLKLVNVYIDSKMLDVSALTQLRSFEMVYSINSNISILGLGRLKKLGFLHFDGVQIRSGSLHEEIGGLTSLQGLYIRQFNYSWSSMIPDFTRLNLLQDVSFFQCREPDMISSLNSNMTHLRRLQLCCCSSLRSCHGLGDLVALEELDLSRCFKLEELPNLGRLKHLLKLDISFCRMLEAVPGAGDLVSLQVFKAHRCSKLAELPKMYKLINLQRLHMDGCPLLKAIPGLSDLVALEALSVDSQGLHGCHDLCKLTKLESVTIRGWSVEGLPCLADLVNLKSLFIEYAQELTDLLNLTRIQTLGIRDCYFEEVPWLSNMTALRSLRMSSCNKLERLPDLHKLSRLEKLDIETCRSLREWHIGWGLRKDVHIAGTFLHLKTLGLVDVPLTELPDLSSFFQLSELFLSACHELTSLTSSAPLAALKRLDLFNCRSLRALPDVSHLVSLSTFKLKDCGELKLTAHEIEKLETMCPGLKLDKRHLSNMDSDAP